MIAAAIDDNYERIRSDLSRLGLSYDRLMDDMLDHVCCMVEELTAGKIKLTFGALYPVLHKLEADGHIAIEQEFIGKRVRKYYSLTETGRSWTEQKVDEFFDFVNTLTHVLKPTPA